MAVLPRFSVFLCSVDLMLPYAVNFKTRSEYPSARAMYDQFLKNRLNDGKNAFSSLDAPRQFPLDPGNYSPGLGWFRSLFHVTPRLLQTRSLKSNAWVAPIRQDALELYLKLHTCLAKGDSVRIEKLTKDPYTTEILLQVRTRRGMQYYWNFHGEVSPTRILSLRATDVDFSKTMPASGSRVTVQALVRFDIEQSVEIYDNTGKALHVPRVTAEPQPARSGKIKRTVPAERKRVIEYLVMEKPMHLLDAEWSFRQQMFPLVGRTVAA
ncbi:hypothetical protein C8J57DRAFT_1323609 [Mycena rebaudengoi]|nr:hypothetical protein C8J57DRAFT_1323609 [Mycena rebaudengoi]